jgi:glycosyltransferase involved in cell wall biosynthesis
LSTGVIAVDGGSRDQSRGLAAHPYARVLEAPRGRATQMNAGAAASKGDVLLFLHADTLVPEQALRAIARAATAPGFVYGGFHHRFSGDDWRLRAISAVHNLRCRITATFYGDQAMFVRRAAFADVNGFPLRLAEDIAISEILRAKAAPAFLPLAVVTSSRKFEQMGVWTSFARVLAILLCLRFGRKPPPPSSPTSADGRARHCHASSPLRVAACLSFRVASFHHHSARATKPRSSPIRCRAAACGWRGTR